MKISYNWLKQFIKSEQSASDIGALLTDLGLEVEVIEKYQTVKGGLEGVVVGHVLSCVKHPNADRLKVTTVDIGSGDPLQIVCGAANVQVGQKVPVATIGTVLFDKNDNPLRISKGKIRDIESHGMICAEDELGLGNSHDGILVLDTNLKPGTPVSTLFKIENDDVFEIGLTPNRSDSMSHFGVARDLRAGLLQKGEHVELITPSVSKFKVEKRTLKIDINIPDSKLIPRYCGVTISGVTVAPSPEWLKNRLKAIGISPKNNVVDVTNYVLHELGQPLHAFDAGLISGKITVKNGIAGAVITTLDDVERKIHEEDIVVCDDNGPLALAGVIGGKASGVTENTKNIFLESAYFNAVSIRKTAKRNGLSTDASFRFERGIDPELTDYALKRAALLIQEVAGGEITCDLIDMYPKKIEEYTFFLNYAKTAKIIGQEIPKETIKKILASLDIKVQSQSDSGLGIVVPAYRTDVTRDIDVVEEILRVYGYNNVHISKKFTATLANSPRTEDYKIQNLTAAQLTALGFHEMMANSLTTPNVRHFLDTFLNAEPVNILNPLSNELSVMRETMLFSGLEAINYNSNRKNVDLKLFEFGKTYHKQGQQYKENKHLSLFFCGAHLPETWTGTRKPTNFFIFKGYITAILNRLGIDKLQSIPASHAIYSEGLSLKRQDEILVSFGSVKKNILKHFDIKQEVFYADFNWEALLKLVATKIKFTDIPKFPEVRRDLALLTNKEVSFETIYHLALETEKSILKDINLFDVYEGNYLPDGKKSYAVSFTLQDQTKTLTDEQIDKTMGKIVKRLQSDLGISLR